MDQLIDIIKKSKKALGPQAENKDDLYSYEMAFGQRRAVRQLGGISLLYWWITAILLGLTGLYIYLMKK